MFCTKKLGKQRVKMPSKECYWKNPEYYRKKAREYHANHPEKGASSSKAWAKENPVRSKIIKLRHYLKNKERIMQRNIERKKELKIRCVAYLGGACNECKLKDDCLDVYCFHHRNPSEKSFNISSKRMSTFERIKKELDKCDLLCSNCHRKEHQVTKMDRHARYRRRKKEKAISIFGGICSDCKLQDDHCIYDFHHLDSSKKDFIFGDNRGWEENEKELLKCVMLCVNCHKKRHTNRSLQNFREFVQE